MSYFQTVSDTVRDHFLDEVNLRWLRVVIDPAGTPATYTPVNVSCDATEEYQRWTFEIKNRAGLSVGLHANLPCVVSFSHNGSDWVVAFTGYVSDDGFRRTRGLVTDDTISIDLVDATKRRGTKRKPEMALLSGFKIVDTTTTESSILHYLASLMGVTVETADIDLTKTIVEIGKDTVWAELQRLRDAFHADMYFRYDGKLLFRSPLEDSYSAPTPEWTFQGDPSESVSGDACRIRGKVEEVFLPVRCNYAKTDFDDLEELSEQVVYKNAENYDSAIDAISIEIAGNSYWPGPNEDDVARLEYQGPESGEKFPFAVSIGTPTIGAYGSGEDIEATGGALEIVSFNGSTAQTSQNADSSEIILYNDSASTCTIRRFSITGTPYRLKSDVTVEHVDAAVSDAIDYVEQSVDGKYMVDKAQAFDTLYHMVEEGKGRPRQFRFSAPFMPWMQRNAIVNVQMPDEESVRCRIDSYNHRNRGRTLQGMMTSIVCTQLGTHTPSGNPTLIVRPQVPAWQAKLTSIAPNASATYRSESTSAPTNPKLGDWWYQTDTQIYKRWDGSDWQNVGGSVLVPSSTAGIAFESSTGNVLIYEDGSFEFGNYNPSTKSGGIKYDVTEDKLLGNVAYDQWDLVIESNADLALLTSGSTTYKNVLVAPGTYTATAQIDLDAHGVERFVGTNRKSCTIDLDYEGTVGVAMIKCGVDTVSIENLHIISSTTQPDVSFYVIGISVNGDDLFINNIAIEYFDNHGYGVSKTFGKDVRISNATAVNLKRGFYSCHTMNCLAYYCDDNFYSCTCVDCYGYDAVSSNFISSRVTGCYSTGSPAYGYNNCFNCSSSSSYGATTANWISCTFVDYDSTNCDQQWTYGNSGANVTTSGWVLPRGKYQLVKSSTAEAVYIQVYDGSGWVQASGANLSSSGAYPGIVESDGVNMRLISASGTQTVYWRNQP